MSEIHVLLPPTAPTSAVPIPPVESALADPTGELTYSSKVPPDHPGLRLDRARPRTLRTGPAIGAALGLLLAAGLAVAVATRSQANGPAKTEPEAAAAKTVSIDESVRAAPGNDSPLRAPAPRLGPPLHGRTLADTPSPPVPAARASSNVAPDPASPAGQRRARRQALLADLDKARGAPVIARLDDPSQADTVPPPPAAAGKHNGQVPGAPVDPGVAALPSALPAAGANADQNLQQHKTDFVARGGVNTATTLDQPIRQHRSPYELLAGAIIPTSLITGINSDLPGQIIGQVRENVYDTVTGQYLLIPQGSRLLATYDSMVGFGQERVLVCWNRLIRPDGISLTLECMPGIDLSGYSGFADDVDHHWWRILGGVAIGSLISAGAQASQGSVGGVQPSLPQLWVGGAAAGVNQATQQITAKNLQIQPTIKIRPGFSVNVLVTKDLVLPPFQGASP